MTKSRTQLLRMLLLVVVPLLIAVGGVIAWQSGGRFVSTENAYVKADIAQISPEVSGRVVHIAVRDHDSVKAGDVLVRIDPVPFRLVLAKTDAALDLARNQLETARASWRETQSELGEVESHAAYLARQLQRQQLLAKTGVVSASKLEEAQNESSVANDRLIVVRRRLERVLTTLGNDPNIATDDHAMVRDKIADRDRAALELARTTLAAPLDGIAVNVKLQLGEQVKAATPLFVIVADHRAWVEANIKETDLTHVRVGQKAKVILDTYPNEVWDGEVASISPAAGSEFAILPPQNASGNWVKVVQRLPVKIRLLPHDNESALRAGMTATIDVDTERQRSLGRSLGSLFGRGTAKAADRQ
ncbi:MAG: HlyD family secretion protein [Acetobacteraceae bacterium]|nr:HlyD family secretion protein [Acetobacteraceae bacterium]